MPDDFGALEIPVPVPPEPEDGVGDPGLVIVGEYLAAVLNSQLGPAWAALVPREPVLVRHAQSFDMNDGLAFNEQDLPSLYLARNIGRTEWIADDYMTTIDDLVVWWVFPTANDEERRQMVAFTNAFRKAVTRALHLERDPSYVAADDDDPSAATLPELPTSIKLAIATSASPVSYSGTALDGSIGAAAVSPKRSITVTGSGSAAAFIPDSIVTVVGQNVLGSTTTWELAVPHVVATPFVLSLPNDCAGVTSVSMAAQASTAGQWSVGTTGFAGYGTMVFDQANIFSITLKRVQPKKLRIDMSDGEPPRVYDMLEMILEVQETLDRDVDAFPYAPLQGTDTAITVGTFDDAAKFPDNGV